MADRHQGVLAGFKDFISRGSVVDLAVAFVIGMAFSAVVTALVDDVVMPLVGAIFGTVNLSADTITLHHSHILYGTFIDAIVAFVSLAAGVYFFVVVPVNAMNARRARGQDAPDSSTRACPECLSDIPRAAIRCAFCTAEVGVA